MNHGIQVLSIAGACIALGFVLLVSTGHDDPYLTFWPAYTLVHFGEIANYNGDHIEQSSSLFHTLSLAAIARATRIEVPTAGYWLGIAASFLTLLRAAALSRALGRRAGPDLMLLLGTFPPFLYWCFGSLETPLVSWLAVEIAIAGVAVVSRRRSPTSPGVILASLAYLSVRPEAGLVLGSTLAVLLVLCLQRGAKEDPARASTRPIATWLVIVAVIFAALIAYRLAYFGAAMPLPVLAKSGASLATNLSHGLAYLSRLVTRPWATTLAPILIALPYLLWRQIRSKSPDDTELFLLLLVGANAAFAVFSGGDWMKGARFFAHIAPVALIVGYRALQSACEASAAPRRASQIVALAIAVQLGGIYALALANSGRPLWRFLQVDPLVREYSGEESYFWSERASRIHTRDILFIDEIRRVCRQLLQDRDRITVMSPQAGMVMYYLAKEFYGRIEFVDSWGLATEHLHRVKDELGLESTGQGLKLRLGKFFEATRDLQDPDFMPDVVYDIYPTAPALERNGYAIVLSNTGADPGMVLRLGPLSYAAHMSMYQYAAVKRDLASRLQSNRPRSLDWTAILRAEMSPARE